MEPVDPETQAKRDARKQKDEARRLTICVQNIHPTKLYLAELWIYFKQFGAIANIVIEERKHACVVYFKEK